MSAALQGVGWENELIYGLSLPKEIYEVSMVG